MGDLDSQAVFLLQGLIYFEKVGYPYGQLTSSNVIIDGGICK